MSITRRHYIISFVLLLSAIHIACAEQVSAVNLTKGSIDFSVNGGAGPLMGPDEDGSGSGGACCAYMPSWSPGLKVEVKWKADQDPFSYAKNPYKSYTKEWYDWMDENEKDVVSYHIARVPIPQYTKQTAANVIAVFLPCHQVMVVNTSKGWKQADFPEKALIVKRYQEFKALEKVGKCPAL